MFDYLCRALASIIGRKVMRRQRDVPYIRDMHAPASPADEPTVNMRFKNGTTDPVFHDLTLFGEASLPLSQFISQLAVRFPSLTLQCHETISLSMICLQPIAVNTTQEWCTACNQTSLRGCSVFN